MGSVTVDDGEWFDDLEDSLEENSAVKSERVMSTMETLDRKRVSKDALDRYPPGREKTRGLVESMMKCVITDSTLEHGGRSYQLALTPRTERKYQSPLLSGRRVLSQIPRAAVANSPLNSPRRPRGGQERVRVYDSPARMPRNGQRILQSKLILRKEHSSSNSRKGDVVSRSENCEDQYSAKHVTTPVPTKHMLQERYSQPLDKEVIVMKGLLWVQQDKLFSKWKERFIVLTSHYIQFFKKASSRISEMGAFIMKVKLSDLSSVSLEDRRGYLTLVIFCQKEGRMVVRKTEGIREWHDCLELFLSRSRSVEETKMESTEQFWDRAVKNEEVKSKDHIARLHSHPNLPISSPIMVKSRQTLCRTPNLLPPTSLCSRSIDEDSGLESMKTSTSDSGSSSLHAAISVGASVLEGEKLEISEGEGDYRKFEKEGNDSRNLRKEKHERGVSMAEYSKFRAKLPFITP